LWPACLSGSDEDQDPHRDLNSLCDHLMPDDQPALHSACDGRLFDSFCVEVDPVVPGSVGLRPGVTVPVPPELPMPGIVVAPPPVPLLPAVPALEPPPELPPPPLLWAMAWPPAPSASANTATDMSLYM
jgi:hypothetical protein